jgi:hypothetical protein
MPSLRELEPEVWSELQFGTSRLGDERRTRRLVRYARQMAEKPDASTPRQTENWADCKAAYRLFQQEDVTFEAVTAVHYRHTLDSLSGTYLVISDTTEIDYGYQSPRKGLGRLTAKQRRGFFLHSALVVDAEDGQIMGVGAQELFTRSSQKRARVHRVACRKRPSEAEVWGRVIDRVQPINANAKLIHVCDRGADNFDVFAHLQVKNDSWVIRAAQLTRKVRQSGGTVAKLGQVLDAARVLGTYQVYVAANRKQKARWAVVEVRAASITLLRPREGSTAFVMDRDIREIESNVVEVREADPPKGSPPIRWVLYTRESVANFQAAVRVIEYYERRSGVEEYHKCLKTGLQVERRQYQSGDRLEPVIGVTCVQAARLLQLKEVARTAPDTPARRLVPREWLDVLRKILKRPRPTQTVREFIRAVASLGGFLGRKSDGEPGWQTIWHGVDTLLMAIRGYRAALKCG